MKNYINLFYDMIDKINNWETLTYSEKEIILSNFLNNGVDMPYLVKYFEEYRLNLSNNTLIYQIKGVIKP